MQTHKLIRPLIVAVGLVGFSRAHGQASVLGNAGGTLDYLGWDNTNAFPLEIRHDGNQPIDWYTNALQRMRLYQDISPAINGYSARPRDGSLLLSNLPVTFTSVDVPFSRLHLADVTGSPNLDVIVPQRGWRPWMRNGVTFSGNSDQGYLGQKYGLNDIGGQVTDDSDMVLHWSNDSEGELGPDRMRFIFTVEPDGSSSSGAASLEGLEGMRLTPVLDENENIAINVGIGDFYAGNVNFPLLVDEPTERLDVLDGRVRVRQLPTDPPSSSMEAVVVNTTTGVLEHRPFPTTTGGVDCKWAEDANHNVYTAVAAVSGGPCPDLDNRVALGDYPSNTSAKLHVEQRPRTGQNETAIRAEAWVGSDFAGSQGIAVAASCVPETGLASATYHYGVQATASNAAQENYGVYGKGLNTTGFTPSLWNVGVYGHGTGDGVSYGTYGLANGTNTNYGIYGWSTASATNNNYGVFGRISGTGTGTNYAGYFQGNMHVSGVASCPAMLWTSDASLKTDVVQQENAMSLLTQLRPTTYHFLSAEFPAFGLPTGLQRGLIAQEVEEVLPDVVSEIDIAPVIDSTGQVQHAGGTVKGINYVALVPLLIAGIQEQQAQLNNAFERIDQLEHALAACCANPDRDALAPQGATGTPTDGSLDLMDDSKLRIVPNPFSEPPTVYYTLDRAGRMQLMANSADGKQLKVLQEANLAQGSYQFDWNTSDLAPGMYYVTLHLDGQQVVQKAVKVTR